MEGTVVRLVLERQFGFINSNGKEYFFHKDDFYGHFSDLAQDMMEGKKIKVEFDSVPSNKGPRAANVQRLDAGVPATSTMND